MAAHNWHVNERVLFDDGYERGEGTVIDIAKLGAKQHLLIEWDDGAQDTLRWHGEDSVLHPLATLTAGA